MGGVRGDDCNHRTVRPAITVTLDRNSREGILAKVDFEDRAWYGALPVVGHLVETAWGVALILRAEGFEALALALGVLLIVGVHNAWDITIWAIGRKSS